MCWCRGLAPYLLYLPYLPRCHVQSVTACHHYWFRRSPEMPHTSAGSVSCALYCFPAIPAAMALRHLLSSLFAHCSGLHCQCPPRDTLTFCKVQGPCAASCRFRSSTAMVPLPENILLPNLLQVSVSLATRCLLFAHCTGVPCQCVRHPHLLQGAGALCNLLSFSFTHCCCLLTPVDTAPQSAASYSVPCNRLRSSPLTAVVPSPSPHLLLLPSPFPHPHHPVPTLPSLEI